MASIKQQAIEPGVAGILTVLEPDQLVEARLQPFGRRQLSRAAQVAMWGLRIYAVLMLFVVIYDVVQVIYNGG